MAKIEALFLLALLCTISGVNGGRDVKEKKLCAWVSALPGGCPDLVKCSETCKPCLKGRGDVIATCYSPSIWVTKWECRCTFVDGAPCPPPNAVSCPSNAFYPPTTNANSTI
ncbi:NFX1-type zinc finger-containing protein 1 [Bienertia sinuspersici]